MAAVNSAVFIILTVSAFLIGRITAPKEKGGGYSAIAESKYKTKAGLLEGVKRQ